MPIPDETVEDDLPAGLIPAAPGTSHVMVKYRSAEEILAGFTDPLEIGGALKESGLDARTIMLSWAELADDPDPQVRMKALKEIRAITIDTMRLSGRIATSNQRVAAVKDGVLMEETRQISVVTGQAPLNMEQLDDSEAFGTIDLPG